MAKLFSLVLVIAVVAVCTASPARLNNLRQSRFLARQELAADVPSQTPYPPSGIKPDIPFELPNAEQEPQEPLESLEPVEPLESTEPEVPQQPDNTYLPPDNLLPPAQTYGPPDQFYGPPEVQITDDEEVKESPDQNELSAVEPEPEEVENSQSERLVLVKRLRKQGVQPAKLRSAKLQALPATRPRSQRLVAQPIYSTAGSLVAYRVLRA